MASDSEGFFYKVMRNKILLTNREKAHRMASTLKPNTTGHK